MQNFTPGLVDQRANERLKTQELQAAAVNKIIAKYGYELKVVPNKDCPECINYELFQGNKQIMANIFKVGTPTVNTRGDDFALWLSYDRGEMVLRNNGLQSWEPGNHGYLGPVFVGNDLVQIEGGSGETATVKRGSQAVYTTLGVGPRADNPNKGLWSWDGHWVLEVEGKVLIDGKSLNEERGYDEIFNWRLLNGQPFYFFKKGNSIGISYAGKVLEQKYDDVVHYKCCETSMYNPTNYETLVQIHALRDGTWYYVELGN
jgi:hypothetical protein